MTTPLKGPRKTFDFQRDSRRVLLHLQFCSVCLSRLTAAVTGTAGNEGPLLLQHFAHCARLDLERLAAHDS